MIRLRFEVLSLSSWCANIELSFGQAPLLDILGT